MSVTLLINELLCTDQLTIACRVEAVAFLLHLFAAIINLKLPLQR